MKNKNKNYYVQVIVGNKIKFVTSVDYEHKTTQWDDDQNFKKFDNKLQATDIATGLCLNGYYAFVVESFYPLDFKNESLK